MPSSRPCQASNAPRLHVACGASDLLVRQPGAGSEPAPRLAARARRSHTCASFGLGRPSFVPSQQFRDPNVEDETAEFLDLVEQPIRKVAQFAKSGHVVDGEEAGSLLLPHGGMFTRSLAATAASATTRPLALSNPRRAARRGVGAAASAARAVAAAGFRARLAGMARSEVAALRWTDASPTRPTRGRRRRGRCTAIPTVSTARDPPNARCQGRLASRWGPPPVLSCDVAPNAGHGKNQALRTATGASHPPVAVRVYRIHEPRAPTDFTGASKASWTKHHLSGFLHSCRCWTMKRAH